MVFIDLTCERNFRIAQVMSFKVQVKRMFLVLWCLFWVLADKNLFFELCLIQSLSIVNLFWGNLNTCRQLNLEMASLWRIC